MDDDEFHKLEAKEEAQKAAVALTLLGITPTTLMTLKQESAPLLLLSQKKMSSSDSVASTENAIQRGSMRALAETNEETDDPFDSSTGAAASRGNNNHLLDLATIAENDDTNANNAQQDDRSKRMKKGFLKKGLLKRFSERNKLNNNNNNNNNKAPKVAFLAGGISKEAWMCGCCGKVFSTFEATDYHERNCIREVINGGDFKIDGKAAAAAQQQQQRKPSAVVVPVDDQRDEEHNNKRGSVIRSQPFSPDFAAAREAFLSAGNQLLLSPAAAAAAGRSDGGDVVDDALLNELGLGDTDEKVIRVKSKSIFSSARSFQSGVPSPWDQSNRNSSHGNSSYGYSNQLSNGYSNHFSTDVVNEGLNDVTSSVIRQPGVSFQSPISGRLNPRHGSSSSFSNDPVDILLTRSMKHQLIITDEALVNSVAAAAEIVLTSEELDAERDLKYLASDKTYYDHMTQRACEMKTNPIVKFRTDGKTVANKIQNKFVDAWQLIKEGDNENQNFNDEYVKKHGSGGGGSRELVHDGNTHYINVIVKHSIRVVNSELERLAEQRWEDQAATHAETRNRDPMAGNFEQFRKFAHVNLVKLAKLALAADFTPRKVSVQLSNDLYR